MDKKEYKKLWYLKNKEKLLKRFKENYEKKKEERLQKMNEYYQNHKNEIAEYKKEWHKEYVKTKYGKATHLVSSYKYKDKQYNRGECTLTPQWIVDNIFSKPCVYCGKTDWTELGCDRIDNSKPHTKDNVVPCCEECNKKRGTKSYEEFIKGLQMVSKPL